MGREHSRSTVMFPLLFPSSVEVGQQPDMWTSFILVENDFTLQGACGSGAGRSWGDKPFVLQNCGSLEEFPLSLTILLWAHLQGHRPGVQLPCLLLGLALIRRVFSLPNLLRPCLQLALPPAALRAVFPPWELICSPLEILDSPSKGHGSLFSPTQHLGSAWVTC